MGGEIAPRNRFSMLTKNKNKQEQKMEEAKERVRGHSLRRNKCIIYETESKQKGL